MPNLINRVVSSEYESLFVGELDTLLLQPVGLSVEQSNAFRGKLHESGLRMTVVRGALARRIFEARGLSGLDAMFEGPSAVVMADSDDVECVAITASRVVEAWRKETKAELPAVKGGLMDGEVLNADQAAKLAKLPTKPDLQSRISGQIIGPASRLSSQFIAGGARIAGAIKTHIKNLEGEG